MATSFFGGELFGGEFFNSGPPTPTFTVDTHDGVDEEFRRRDEEIRQARLRLREQLREVVLGVTGKPPSLDASPKELAAIARKSDAFDYRAALQEISRLDAEAKAVARARDEVAQAELRRKVRRQEEETLLMLLLN